MFCEYETPPSPSPEDSRSFSQNNRWRAWAKGQGKTGRCSSDVDGRACRLPHWFIASLCRGWCILDWFSRFPTSFLDPVGQLHLYTCFDWGNTSAEIFHLLRPPVLGVFVWSSILHDDKIISDFILMGAPTCHHTTDQHAYQKDIGAGTTVTSLTLQFHFIQLSARPLSTMFFFLNLLK